MLRTAFTMLVLLVTTIVLGTLVLVARLLGVDRQPNGGGVYKRAPEWWARSLLWAAGVKVVGHGLEREGPGVGARVYVANHVSWFDILALVDILPHYGFVAKRELERVPLFGPAARAVGVIYIDRENLKAAFSAYEDAAERIRSGQSVVVFPEGTRGDNYALRPFKKGPFVLAIKSGAPIVPVVIHGTREVNPRGSLMAHSGVVNVHLLEPIPTDGLSYDDRDALARQVHGRMADALRTLYGVTDTPTLHTHQWLPSYR